MTLLEKILVFGAVGIAVAALAVVLTLLGIVIIELMPEHTRRLKAWIRGFKPRRRLPTRGLPMLTA